MLRFLRFAILFALLGAVPLHSRPSLAAATGPLRVLAGNKRYFTDGSGKAIWLTGSHVWENFQDRGTTSPPPAFDFNAYLDFLQARNHNFIRLWNWEQARWAPWTTGDDYSSPMPYNRSGPGTALDGAPKFNLDQFNQGYFDRLRARVIAAGNRGIYVSVKFFEGWSIDNVGKGPGNPWPGHPFNGSNNVNGLNGDANNNGQGEETHTLAVPAVTARQEAYVRKVIDTVNDLDNVLYEIANESGSVLPGATDWQYHMIDYVHGVEGGKPKQHPVGMTFQYPNGNNAALFNSPADWIAPNEAGGYKDNPPAADGSKVILSDTDHLWGEGGDRSWVWKTFTRGLQCLFMDGGIETFPATNDWRESARLAMGQARSYADRMDLAAMTPRGDLSSTGYALAHPGVEYLVYQSGSGGFTVNLDAGTYSVEWMNPSTGALSSGSAAPASGSTSFNPPFGGDAVLYMKSTVPPPPPPPAGDGTGLRGDYYGAMDFSGLVLTRTDATIDFDWGPNSPDASIGADRFSVRWTGQILPQYSETTTFYTVSDDGVRLWVNGTLLIDNWTDHGSTEDSGTIELQAGHAVDLKMEFYENGGDAVAKLLWSSPSLSKGTIPASQMSPVSSGSVPAGTGGSRGSGGGSGSHGGCGLLGLEVPFLILLSRRRRRVIS